MATFTPQPIIDPQFIPVVAAPLVLHPGAGGPSVPANFTYQVTVARVTNVSGAPVSLSIWRVPAGTAADNQHLIVPSTVIIPAASASAPWFDLTVIWGINLLGGAAIWAQAGAANALAINADGLVIQ